MNRTKSNSSDSTPSFGQSKYSSQYEIVKEKRQWAHDMPSY